MPSLTGADLQGADGPLAGQREGAIHTRVPMQNGCPAGSSMTTLP